MFKFAKLQMFCSFQVENDLVFTVCLPDTSAACSLGYHSHWFQSNPGDSLLRSNLHIWFPPLFVFLLKSLYWNNISKSWNASGNQLNFLHSSQKTVGRKRSQQTESAGLKLQPWDLHSPGAISEHCRIISDCKCTEINIFNNHGLLNISSAAVPNDLNHGLWVWCCKS